MENEDFKKDLDNYLKQHLDPINKKMIEQEKQRHDEFLQRHFEKYETLSDKDSSSVSQLITLEGVIFTAIIVLSNPQQASVWLFLGICSILISLFFGVWLQRITMQAKYQMHEDDYYQEVKSNWWKRELWGDETVKSEKELVEPQIKKGEDKYKKTTTYKILKFFKLNADRIEIIFRGAFLLAVLFLVIHFASLSFLNSKIGFKNYNYERRPSYFNTR